MSLGMKFHQSFASKANLDIRPKGSHIEVTNLAEKGNLVGRSGGKPEDRPEGLTSSTGLGVGSLRLDIQ